MATSLYEFSVPTFLQTVSAVAGFLGRAHQACLIHPLVADAPLRWRTSTD